MKQIKAQEVPLGRQAKCLNLLRRVALLIGVSFRKAKRRDIEDLLTRLSDYEIVRKDREGKRALIQNFRRVYATTSPLAIA